MGPWLVRLSEGSDQPACDSKDSEWSTDDLDVDTEKFKRGQNFFKNNLMQCVLAMLTSLVAGLSVNNLLEVLIATQKSSTAKASLYRYLDTFRHIMRWHYGNVFNEKSSAALSIQQVRRMHSSARTMMQSRSDNTAHDDTTDRVFVSQYDMAVVQSGFFGMIIMYPREMGIRCTVDDLDDYVYFWRWIGSFLGIKDQFNICIHGYAEAYDICKEIETEIVVPSNINPPPGAQEMVEAFVNGLNLFSPVSLYSSKCILNKCYNLVQKPPPFELTFYDRCRKLFFDFMLTALYYVPIFSKLCNRSIEAVFNAKSIT